MAHISPEFVGLDPLNLVGFDVGQRLARHGFQHPVHHCVVADPHQPFGRPQAHALKVVRQGAGPLGRRHPPMIPFAAGLAARPAQPALPPVAATTIFHHRFIPAMLAFHPRILSELPSKSIPNEQSLMFQEPNGILMFSIMVRVFGSSRHIV